MGALNLNSFLMGDMDDPMADLSPTAASGEEPRVVGGKYMSWPRSSALGAGGEGDDHVGSFPAMAGVAKSKRIELAGRRTWPQSYRKLSRQEAIALEYVHNFDRQFVQLYPMRRRLLLSPMNECSVEKFVCTTLRPTQTQFDQLYSLDGIASFVADHIVYEPLAEPTKVPAHLPSPATTLDWQVGDAFDMAALLVSLLLGVGYDAYVVYGTAAYSLTVNDTFSSTWPGLGPAPDPPTPPPPAPAPKFVVQTRPRLVSKFEQRMAASSSSSPTSSPTPNPTPTPSSSLTLDVGYSLPLTLTQSDTSDHLRGKRVHAWVLVKQGARGVEEDIFIEPSRGIALPTSSPLYHSIEAVFNATNFYANVQPSGPRDERTGLYSAASLSLDLHSLEAWEPVFMSSSSSSSSSAAAAAAAAAVSSSSGLAPSASTISHAVSMATMTDDSRRNKDKMSSTAFARATSLAVQEHILAKAAGIDMFGPVSPSLVGVTHASSKEEADENDQAARGKLKVVSPPPSWVMPLALSPNSFEERYAGGAKILLHSRLRVELYGPYLRSDGMIRRLTHYADESCTLVFRVDEVFAHRRDKLVSRVLHPFVAEAPGSDAIGPESRESFEEHFNPGRDHGLKKLRVFGEVGLIKMARAPQRKARRLRTLVSRYEMEFYPEGRASHDALVSRVIDVGSFLEDSFSMALQPTLGGEYVSRRSVSYQYTREQLVKAHPLDLLPGEEYMVSMEEDLARRPDVANVDDDVASRKFLVARGDMREEFHLIDGHIFPSRITYKKHPFADSFPVHLDELPPRPTDYQEPEEVCARQAWSGRSSHDLYVRYVNMVRAENDAAEAVTNSIAESKSIITSREKERDRCLLVISVYDTLRRKIKRSQSSAEAQAQSIALSANGPSELEDDPFAVFFHGKLPTSIQDAHAIKNEALEFHRDRIISQVLIIESKMGRIRQHLKEREATIIRNQDHTTSEEVAEFADEKVRLQFRLRVLKMRKEGILRTYRRKFKLIAQSLWDHPLLAPWFAQEDRDPDDPDDPGI